jgi:hypothetical protein
MPAVAPTASVVAASVCLFTWNPFDTNKSFSQLSINQLK